MAVRRLRDRKVPAGPFVRTINDTPPDPAGNVDVAGGGGGASAAEDVTFTPAGGVAATDVQAALEELDTEKSDTGHDHDADYATVGHTHAGGGPTGMYDPTVSRPSGLVSWHRWDTGLTVTSGRVDSWAAKGGSGTFTAGSTKPYAVRNPYDGTKYALEFTGGEWMTSGIVPATGAGARTIALWVMGSTKFGSGYEHMCHYGAGSTNNAYGIVGRGSGAGWFANHYWSGQYDAMGPFAAATPRIIVMRYNGTQDQLIVNGVYSRPVTTTPATSSSSGLVLGSRISPLSEGAAFILLGVATWSDDLTDSELDTLFSEGMAELGVPWHS